MVKENINNFTLMKREICKSESFYADYLGKNLKKAEKIKINATSVTLHPLWHVI